MLLGNVGQLINGNPERDNAVPHVHGDHGLARLSLKAREKSEDHTWREDLLRALEAATGGDRNVDEATENYCEHQLLGGRVTDVELCQSTGHESGV
jgi:hypothetical protein